MLAVRDVEAELRTSRPTAVARPNFTIEEVESNLLTFLRDVRAVGTSTNAFDEAGNKREFLLVLLSFSRRNY